MGGLIHVGAWDGAEYTGDNSGRRLLLFEPQLRPFRQLMANVGGRSGVYLVNAAAGAKRGVTTMYRVEPDHSSSLLSPAVLKYGFTRNGQETVRLTTVDAEVEHFNLGRSFDEMRIDTQGYELEVLRGSEETLKSLLRVECELHDPSTYPGAALIEDLAVFMTKRGFKLTSMTPREGDDPAACFERLEL